ncbi:MAG TPA: ester cyclase [Chthoniobacteraceae bacterium]|jgi:predicted ester cyclase|nr:SnoaL-like polyketide cyclase [Chthoniobacter sp.]HEV7868041.1 ester cyclase [Chthoniobacteraceae bacterium]
MSAQTRELARRWFEEVWNERRADTIEELVHPHCIGHHEGRMTRGSADLKVMRDQLLTMVADLRVVIEDICAEDDNAVVRWRFAGVSSAGSRKPISFEGMTWLKFSEGKVIEGWDRWNQAAFLQQVAM